MSNTPSQTPDPQDQADAGRGLTPSQSACLQRTAHGIGRTTRPAYSAASYGLLPEEIAAASSSRVAA